MLVELRVRDIGIIEDINWSLGPGLNVITGETGAGKSLVIDAVEALLAARTSITIRLNGQAVPRGLLQQIGRLLIEFRGHGGKDLPLFDSMSIGIEEVEVVFTVEQGEVLALAVDINQQATDLLEQPPRYRLPVESDGD